MASKSSIVHQLEFVSPNIGFYFISMKNIGPHWGTLSQTDKSNIIYVYLTNISYFKIMSTIAITNRNICSA